MAENGTNPGAEPSVEDLARRLMDLWQEQMAAIAADPDLMRQMATMMAASPFPAMMQGIMQGIMAASANPGGQNPYEWWKSDGSKPPAPARPPAPGTPSAAPASQPGGGDLVELRRHLAGLEARLAELGAAGREIAEAAGKPKPDQPKPDQPKPDQPKPDQRKPARRPARKSPKPVAGPAGGSGAGGAGGAGGGAAG